MTATRRQAREWAVQLLTAADLNPTDDIAAFKLAFWEQVQSLDAADGGSGGDEVRGKLRNFAEERFDGVMRDMATLDERLSSHMDGWEMGRLGTVERAVLRMGAWELDNTDIPTPVIINEAVDLSNWYSTPKSRYLVNSVLDKYAKSIEPARSERIANAVAAAGSQCKAKSDAKTKSAK